MIRLWYSTAVGAAAALTAAGGVAESPGNTSAPVMGEMVDAEAPATYRLPPVQVPATAVGAVALPLFPAPLASSANWAAPAAVDIRIMPVLAPAGSFADRVSDDEADGGESPPDLSANAEQIETEAKCFSQNRRGLAHFAESSEQKVPVPLSADGSGISPKPPAAPAADPPRPTESRPATLRSIDLTSQLLPAVQRGFGLAQRGAMYAARTEFVQVLRRVAQARDAAAGGSESSRALAAGLRALDEADDFVPTGVQLEAELDVRTTASSHRTNVLPEAPEEVSPSEAVDLYHVFARRQLRIAVGHEQAGSMALHGLGTIYARLAARKDDNVQLTRTATTMYSAAVDACPDNHLAANELGVLVCRSGRAEEAAALFMQAIDFAPSAVAYHNLAIAQQRSGQMAGAAANERESQRLAAQERARGDVSRRAGVRWVTPEEMARATQPIRRSATPAVPAGPQSPVPPPTKSTWQRVVDSAKSLPLPGVREKQDLGPKSVERVARPNSTATANERHWR